MALKTSITIVYSGSGTDLLSRHVNVTNSNGVSDCGSFAFGVSSALFNLSVLPCRSGRAAVVQGPLRLSAYSGICH